MTAGPEPFFTVYHDRYAPGTVESDARVAAVLPFLERNLPAPGAHVLDLCCGAGVFAFALERLGHQVRAVDRDPHLLAQARAYAALHRSAVTFEEGDASTIPLPEASLDAVVLLGNVLPAFPLDVFSGIMERLYLALRPAGRVIVDHVDPIGALIEAGPVATYDVTTGPPVVVVRGPYNAREGTLGRLHLDLGTGVHALRHDRLWAPWILAHVCGRAGFTEQARESYSRHRYLSRLDREKDFLL